MSKTRESKKPAKKVSKAAKPAKPAAKKTTAPKKPAKASKKTTKASAPKKGRATSPKVVKPSIISQMPAKPIFDDTIKFDNSSKVDELFGAWYDTTLGNEKVSFNEVFHRISTIFRTSCMEFGLEAEEAFSILDDYAMQYAEDVDYEYVCDDCKAEQEAAPNKNETNKLLN